MNVYGIIYRIVNIVNGKSYIGKTKSHYGDTPFGAENRLKQHINNSNSRPDDCPRFYNAIKNMALIVLY